MTTLTLFSAWVPTRAQVALGLMASLQLITSGAVDHAKAVPFTLQMIPVLMIGMLFSPRQAIVTVGTTAAVMALTLSAHRVGVTGGYMVGWVLAVGLMAWLMQGVREGTFTSFVASWRMLAAGVLGYTVVWFCGWTWLAYGAPQLEADKAFAVGVYPFLLGAPLKLVLAFGLVLALRPTLQLWR